MVSFYFEIESKKRRFIAANLIGKWYNYEQAE